MRHLLILAVLMALCASPASAKAAETGAEALEGGLAPQEREPLTIFTARSQYLFEVEVVRNGPAMQRGLMFRTEIPPYTGMLFDFGSERSFSMWMKNTLVPLDMLFINASGKIVDIAEHTIPLSLRPITPKSPAAAVLEVAGGSCKRYGIRIGDRVKHSLFNTEP